MAAENSFTYQKTIKASVDLVYRAFTSSTSLREWLCDFCTTNPVVGGRIYLAWERGYFAAGAYTRLNPQQAIVFTWIGKQEPDWTSVTVQLTPLDEHTTQVNLTHTGIGDGEAWESARREISNGWELGLENLKSTLETGLDLRVTQRPLIGIYPEEVALLTDLRRKELAIDIQYGALVTDVVPDYGADLAGIQPGDVLIAVDGKPVDRVKTLLAILGNYQAGDQIDIDVLRRGQKYHFLIDAKAQQLSVFPETPEGLAKELEARSSKALETLEHVLDGVTEAEAAFTPGPEEWSTKETLVHLIHIERELQIWISDLVAGQEKFSDEWTNDNLFRIRATLASYPSVNELLAELRRNFKESVALVAYLDQDFTKRKTSYWRLGSELMIIRTHTREHIHQIEDNLQAARSIHRG